MNSFWNIVTAILASGVLASLISILYESRRIRTRRKNLLKAAYWELTENVEKAAHNYRMAVRCLNAHCRRSGEVHALSFLVFSSKRAEAYLSFEELDKIEERAGETLSHYMVVVDHWNQMINLTEKAGVVENEACQNYLCTLAKYFGPHESVENGGVLQCCTAVYSILFGKDKGLPPIRSDRHSGFDEKLDDCYFCRIKEGLKV